MAINGHEEFATFLNQSQRLSLNFFKMPKCAVNKKLEGKNFSLSSSPLPYFVGRVKPGQTTPADPEIGRGFTWLDLQQNVSTSFLRIFLSTDA